MRRVAFYDREMNVVGLAWVGVGGIVTGDTELAKNLAAHPAGCGYDDRLIEPHEGDAYLDALARQYRGSYLTAIVVEHGDDVPAAEEVVVG